MIDHSLPSPTMCGEQSLDEEGSSDHGHGGRGCGGQGCRHGPAQGSSEPLAAVKEDWHAVEASPLSVPTPHTDETTWSAQFDDPQSSSDVPGGSPTFGSPIFNMSDHPITINDPQLILSGLIWMVLQCPTLLAVAILLLNIGFHELCELRC